MTIRPVTVHDAGAAVALWSVFFPEYGDNSHPQRDSAASVGRKLAFGDGLFWLAEIDCRVVGTVMAGYDRHRGWIYSLGVHPTARRIGVGRALLAEAERALFARGAPKINLQEFTHNVEAQAFWQSTGYGHDDVVSFGKRRP